MRLGSRRRPGHDIPNTTTPPMTLSHIPNARRDEADASPTKPEHDLVGTWKLVDWTVAMEGGRTVRPFRGRATGVITYTDEGRMVATLMKTDRPTIGTRSFNEATAMERASAAAGYLSYAGSYEIIGDEVHHHVDVSLFPDWVGGTQIRHIAWITNEDGTVDLELSDLGVGGDRTATIHLRWHRITEERTST